MSEKMLDSGLKYLDLTVGEGAEAEAGNRVTVHYSGWLENGAKFDSSLDRNDPFRFSLGRGQVIQGWDLGVAGMKVGGKRKLTIPSHLGYGARGAGVAGCCLKASFLILNEWPQTWLAPWRRILTAEM
jgi:FKBP-type peptidyl-prolyl cis-trans isomerase FkpA